MNNLSNWWRYSRAGISTTGFRGRRKLTQLKRETLPLMMWESGEK